jgi:hypothetical protein
MKGIEIISGKFLMLRVIAVFLKKFQRSSVTLVFPLLAMSSLSCTVDVKRVMLFWSVPVSTTLILKEYYFFTNKELRDTFRHTQLRHCQIIFNYHQRYWLKCSFDVSYVLGPTPNSLLKMLITEQFFPWKSG